VIIVSSLVAPISAAPVPVAAVALAFWISNGIDKVHQTDLRLTHPERALAEPIAARRFATSAVWNGTQITTTSARNETMPVASVHVENDTASPLRGVRVEITPLVGPNGSVVTAGRADLSALPRDAAHADQRGHALATMIGRDVQVFVARYLPADCLSLFPQSDVNGHESTPGERWKRRGPNNDWLSRLDAEKAYPGPLVPHELEPWVSIAPGTQQEFAIEGYFGDDLTAGVYTGSVNVYVNNTLAKTIPVKHTVSNVRLPAVKALPTMVSVASGAITERGQGTQAYAVNQFDNVLRAHTMLKRRGLTTWNDSGGYVDQGPAGSELGLLLSGSIWTPTVDAYHGYRGPGQNQGTRFWISQHWEAEAGLTQRYGPYTSADLTKLHAYMTRVYNDVRAKDPLTQMLFYVVDEPPESAAAQIEATAAAMKQHPDANVRAAVGSFVTKIGNYNWSIRDCPSVTHWSTPTFYNNRPDVDGADWATYQGRLNARGIQQWTYNGARPEAGAHQFELPGMDHVVLMLHSADIGNNRHFIYESCMWQDFQNAFGPAAKTQLWRTAANFAGPGVQPNGRSNNFGNPQHNNQVGFIIAPFGHADDPGWANTTNHDGLLLFPGLDGYADDQTRDNYMACCPFPTKSLLALGHGVHLADRLVMAKAANPAATATALAKVTAGGWFKKFAYDEQHVGTDVNVARWSEMGDDAITLKRDLEAIILGVPA